jgi:hypothetical protein
MGRKTNKNAKAKPGGAKESANGAANGHPLPVDPKLSKEVEELRTKSIRSFKKGSTAKVTVAAHYPPSNPAPAPAATHDWVRELSLIAAMTDRPSKRWRKPLNSSPGTL